ncbi:hypothetical protein BX600DRAFT_429055 [Xylariales sp. PMI_506]|nr:hypothetical protein BX600DRAFT_429055 [Xylariales sp. PMI_506]
MAEPRGSSQPQLRKSGNTLAASWVCMAADARPIREQANVNASARNRQLANRMGLQNANLREQWDLRSRERVPASREGLATPHVRQTPPVTVTQSSLVTALHQITSAVRIDNPMGHK